MVVTALAVALAEFVGRKGDTTPRDGCGVVDGCFGYRGGVPMLVVAGGMLLIGIVLRVLEVEGRDRVTWVLFPVGLMCVVGLRYARYLVDRGVGPPQTLFPPTFEWMAIDDLALTAVAAFAAWVTAPGGPAVPNRGSLLRASAVLVGLAGLWATLIAVHGDPLH